MRFFPSFSRPISIALAFLVLANCSRIGTAVVSTASHGKSKPTPTKTKTPDSGEGDPGGTTVDNLPPTDIALSVSSVTENSGSNVVVGGLVATDPDDATGFAYSLATGSGDTDNSDFEISESNLIMKAGADFEAKNSYSLRVQVTDKLGTGLSFQKVLSVSVLNVNEPATLSPVANQSSSEDVAVNNIDISMNDPDGTLACSALTGTSSNTTLLPNANITFSGTAPQCKIALAPVVNKSGSTTVTVTVVDGLFTAHEDFTFSVSALSPGSLNSSALGRPAQRKSFFDSTTNKHWGFYFNSSAIAYGYSPDGRNWTSAGTVSYATGDFAVTARGGYVYMAVSPPGNASVLLLKGALGSSSITWDAPQTVFTAAANELYGFPSIALENYSLTTPSDNFIWVAASHTNSAGSVAQARRSTNKVSGDLSQWESTSTVGKRGGVIESVVILPRTGNQMYLIANSGGVVGYSFDGSSWSAAMTGAVDSWFSMNGAASIGGDINTMAFVKGELYVGGYLSVAASKNIGVAKWGGAGWVALGNGLVGHIFALAGDSAGNLYAGGFIQHLGTSSANNVVKWDGTKWTALGSGLGDPAAVEMVTSLVCDSAGNLYASGSFSKAGALDVNGIAKWNGTTWSALGSGFTGGSASSLAFDGSGNLFAAGDFTDAGGQAANHVAKWDGSSWSALGAGIGSAGEYVNKIAFDNLGNLYVGGEFTTAGGLPASRVAKWDGTSWNALAGGISGEVLSIAVDGNGLLYAGARYGSSPVVVEVKKWNGTSWTLVGAINQKLYLNCLIIDSNNKLLVGGNFDSSAGEDGPGLVKWDGTNWGALTPGSANRVYAMAVDSSGFLYAGGQFASIGGTAVNYIAKWNGSTWEALGTGLNHVVYAMAADTVGNIYAGGWFTVAGGVPVARIAKWNGSAWSALGSGLDYMPSALIYDPATNLLYAGGAFTSAGGVAANRVAKWNGAAWSALGAGVDNTVRALEVDGLGNLFVGGDFLNAGGAGANRVAKWNGAAWSALGTGLDNKVYALKYGGGTLYAGGSFSNAGGSAAKRVAKWNGSAWSNVGTEPLLIGSVYALELDGSGSLYAGGNVVTLGGVSVPAVAKWNGSTWSRPQISALGNRVQAIKLHSSKIVLAGETFVMMQQPSITSGSSALAAVSDSSTGDIYLASRSDGTNLELRKMTDSGGWGAASSISTSENVAGFDIVFNSAHGKGAVAWSENNTLLKKNFDATGAIDASSALILSDVKGIFSLGAIDSNLLFPIMFIKETWNIGWSSFLREP